MPKTANLMISGIIATMLSGCILLEDTRTSNSALSSDPSDKYSGKDEVLRKSMNKEAYFDSLNRASNGKTRNEPPAPASF